MAPHSYTVKDTIDLLKSFHQPKGFSFPQRNFGATKRSFKKNGVILAPGFIIMKDLTVFCAFCCCQAIKKHLMSCKTGSSDAAFVSEKASINCYYYLFE